MERKKREREREGIKLIIVRYRWYHLGAPHAELMMPKRWYHIRHWHGLGGKWMPKPMPRCGTHGLTSQQQILDYLHIFMCVYVWWKKFDHCTTCMVRATMSFTTSLISLSCTVKDMHCTTVVLSISSFICECPNYQCRCRTECKPSLSVISAAFIAFGGSCLLANTSKVASPNSSYNTKIIDKCPLECFQSKKCLQLTKAIYQ